MENKTEEEKKKPPHVLKETELNGTRKKRGREGNKKREKEKKKNREKEEET